MQRVTYLVYLFQLAPLVQVLLTPILLNLEDRAGHADYKALFTGPSLPGSSE